MVNLKTKSGENNCYYNISGRCTNPKITRGLAGESGRDWDSKQNCTFTQDGAQSLCSEYFFENIYKETRNKTKNIEIIIPEDMWNTDIGKAAIAEAEKIMRSIRDYQNKHPLREWRNYMSRKTVCSRHSAPSSNEEMPIEVDRYKESRTGSHLNCILKQRIELNKE